MTLQSTASTSDPIKLSEVIDEFDYWRKAYSHIDDDLNTLDGFRSQFGVGPAGRTRRADDPPTDALNLTSFLGKEGGGTYLTFSKTASSNTGYWKNWRTGAEPFYDTAEGYVFSYDGTTFTLTGGLPYSAADYYDYGGYRYFRGIDEDEEVVDDDPDDGEIWYWYAISRISIP